MATARRIRARYCSPVSERRHPPKYQFARPGWWRTSFVRVFIAFPACRHRGASPDSTNTVSWRLRPLRRQLHAYRRTSAGGNPWGYAFGDWGEAFIKSNGTGVSELLPSLVHTDHIGGGFWGGAMTIGKTKIKSRIEIVDSPHLPDDLQGDFLIAGYDPLTPPCPPSKPATGCRPWNLSSNLPITPSVPSI